jgi:hypothetical protein
MARRGAGGGSSMTIIIAQCVIVWLCLQIPLGMLVGRFIASANVIAK